MADGWFVYIIRCADSSLYTGITTELERRTADHSAGRGARYTRGRGPVELIAWAGPMSRSQALKWEYRIKRAPRARKIDVLAAAPSR